MGLNKVNSNFTGKGRSILILKAARTGSTWLCDEMNARGMHVTQESLLHWEDDCPQVHENCEEYLSPDGRVQWVTQSLVKPMPKNPYAFALGCGGILGGTLNAMEIPYTEDKVAACQEAVDCSPPYSDESCSDLRGCFSQQEDQKGCYNAEMSAPAIIGISFNFLSSLGDHAIDKCLDEDPKCIKKQSKVLKEATAAAEKQGVEVLTLAQIRSNLLRWAISRTFHSRDYDNYISKAVQFNEEGDKFAVLSVEGLLHGPVKRMEQLLQMSMEVSKNTKILFYEDLARNVDKSIDALGQSYSHGPKGSASPTEAAEEDVAPDKNVEDQHPGELANYVENMEELREQVRSTQPCIYTMAQDSTAKDETLILPLKEVDGLVKIDFSRNCCFADRKEYIRSVADYVKAGLECQ